MSPCAHGKRGKYICVPQELQQAASANHVRKKTSVTQSKQQEYVYVVPAYEEVRMYTSAFSRSSSAR